MCVVSVTDYDVVVTSDFVDIISFLTVIWLTWTLLSTACEIERQASGSLRGLLGGGGGGGGVRTYGHLIV